MKAYERFLNYVQIHTTSDADNAGKSPSTHRQFDLAHLLVKEMKNIGMQDAYVDEKCYVYGHLPASPGLENANKLGFVAHMDTSPDASGENVKPLLNKNYDGGDVLLPSGRVIDVGIFPEIAAAKGKTLITASGDTLLGADDKAGIAEILTACDEINKSGMEHGEICVAFTPDEEVGAGADFFRLEALGADFAYTVDGGNVLEVEYESFNAADAKAYFTGVSVHTGSADGIMVNAAKLAIEFNAMLPAEAPENTKEREGFFHLSEVSGNVESAYLHYIVRDHDRQKFEARKNKLADIAAEMQKLHGDASVRLELKDSYYNMGEVIEKHFHLVENACAALEELGLAPIIKPIRGGTDGSRLSFMGLPCPNIGTGGMYYHGPNECIAAEDMDVSVELIKKLVAIYAKRI